MNSEIQNRTTPEVEQFTNEMKLRWMFNTGFGHGLERDPKTGRKLIGVDSKIAGLRIQMSDRMYEVQKNGEYRRVA